MPRYQQRPTQISSSSTSDLDLELGQHRSRSRSQNRRQFAVDSSSGSDEWGSGSSEGSEVDDSEEEEKKPLPRSHRPRSRARVERDLPHGGENSHPHRPASRLSNASTLIESPEPGASHLHLPPNHPLAHERTPGEGVNHEHEAFEMRPISRHGTQTTIVVPERQGSRRQRSGCKTKACKFFLNPWFWALAIGLPVIIGISVWLSKLSSSGEVSGGTTTDRTKYESPY
ncbi:hypothetical protein T439DRAFT_375229 [Meredithblackwellia eburnea MCA 4105]